MKNANKLTKKISDYRKKSRKIASQYEKNLLSAESEYEKYYKRSKLFSDGRI